MSVEALDRVAVTRAVKTVVIAESRLSIDPDAVSGGEPLNGELLRVNSFGFVGMLVRLEDDLGVTLPDDLFVGRTFTTVDDLVAVVLDAVGAAR